MAGDWGRGQPGSPEVRTAAFRLRRPVGGFSLLEAVIALAILGWLVVTVAGLVSVHSSAFAATENRFRALEAAQTAMESVRGGVAPLESGDIPLEGLVDNPPGTLLLARVEVSDGGYPGLYEVKAVGVVRGTLSSAEVELWSKVWRP